MYNVPRYHVRKKPPCPCHGCEDRCVGCHSTCEKYAGYKKANFADWCKLRDTYRGETEAKLVEVAACMAAIERKNKARKRGTK